MLEIEIFNYTPRKKAFNVWINSELKFTYEIKTEQELIDIRDNLDNELLWINRYLNKNKAEE